MEELLSDLADCQARQVHVIADQSYSGEIARAVKRSISHRNVVVFTSSKDHEYSWGADFTHLWASTNHTHKCAQDVHRVSFFFLNHHFLTFHVYLKFHQHAICTW